ncbi:MAG: polysaccharide export protein [Maricaulaceae bacterium]|nr:polysaccharide export protein [Maricaulaceae bacterium]
MRPALIRLSGALLIAAFALSACGTRAPAPHTRDADPQLWQAVRFEDWRETDPVMRFFPGDVLEVIVHSAPELTRTVTVAPDGRISLPLARSVMVSGLSAPEAAGAVADAFTDMLRNPIVEVTPQTFGTRNILVGGQVASPGLYEIPGRIGALEAVMLAGGFRDTARRAEVVILRRSPSGGIMMRTVNLRAALRGDGSGDPFPLRRHDVVYVPRTTIAEINVFVDQYVRGLLPFDEGLSYLMIDALRNN